MTGPPPAVAAVRVAVRAALAAHLFPDAGGSGGRKRREPAAPAADRPLVLVACSGGADSLALAAATAFVAPRLGVRAGLVSVDHGLQAGSAERAAEVAEWGRGEGLAPAEAVTVDPAGRGGPEGAARGARYRALAAAAGAHGAAAVLLGHSRDDQAETVLLALARGAGPRGLAGMPAARRSGGTTLLRPLLELPRARLRQCCGELGLRPWEDPHNTDPAFARSRVRANALPALVAALGERVVANLARTATLVAADNAALGELAGARLAEARDGAALRVARLAALPAALRTRVLHAWVRERGAPGGDLTFHHVAAVEALVTRWRGQGPIDLPGPLRVSRSGDRLHAG